MPRQRVSNGVELPYPVLDREVVPEQFGDLGVLWDCREALVEDELEAPVVGSNGECVTLDIRTPMLDTLDQDYELALISRELGVVRGGDSTEVHHGAIALVQHSTKLGIGRR